MHLSQGYESIFATLLEEYIQLNLEPRIKILHKSGSQIKVR